TKDMISDDQHVFLWALKTFAAGDKAIFKVYEFYKAVVYEVEEFLPLSSVGKGMEYGDWINGRSTAETDPRTGVAYIATHEDNDKGPNGAPLPDLIENFAGLIESVLHDQLSLDDTEIDQGSLNVSSNDLPVASYRGIATVLERRLARELLFGLCRDCRSYLWWQPDGYIKHKVMDDTYAASDRVIDARDVMDLKFDRTPIRDIRTAVNVLYNLSGDRYLSATGILEDT
ncbi:unnamed protein product, partial [marine sediment metagenome]